ncbi:Uncharacterized protein HZ326_30314, partial [Fusarium oxysporum f. sp. albedinis]
MLMVLKKKRFDYIVEFFNKGYTAAHIISGFEKSGLFPPTDRPATTYLLRKQLKSKQAVDPAYNSLLPPETRFLAASDTARHVGEISRCLQFPNSLGTQTHPQHRQRSYIARGCGNKRKRGNRAKPVGDYIHYMRLKELRDQQEESITDGREKDRKPQIRSTRSIILREMESLKEEWRANNGVIINGAPKKLQFKHEKTDGLMTDTELPESVHFSTLPQSDDGVTYYLTQPPADEETDEEEETLPLIEVADYEEVEMPSSPPYL